MGNGWSTLRWMVVCLAIIGVNFAGLAYKDNQIATLKADKQELELSLERATPHYVAPIAVKALGSDTTLMLDRIAYHVGPDIKVLACGELNYGFNMALPGAPVLVVNHEHVGVGKVLGEIH